MNLNRFIDAQEDTYEIALQEIKKGKKESHWMWFIFPQIIGLGTSYMAEYYGIKDIEEAKAYINHEVLGSRLLEITKCLLDLDETNAVNIFGPIDALKLNSCMTLFSLVSTDSIFNLVIDKYFYGKKDELTLDKVQAKKRTI